MGKNVENGSEDRPQEIPEATAETRAEDGAEFRERVRKHASALLKKRGSMRVDELAGIIAGIGIGEAGQIAETIRILPGFKIARKPVAKKVPGKK